ncbi:MAG TPA: hypothetical protein VML55_10885, partial [Planctomycetaceae bacterium]|nr:hypothetical protein [Planctomycetaceae bacterium]
MLTFDRLPARFLGCYGNEDAATPAFDWLAAESVVFEFHYCEHAAAEAPGHAWWTGRHHFPHPREVQRGFPSLTCSLAAAGGRTILVSERDAAPLAPPFGETIEVGGREGLSVEADETPFARLIDAAEEQLAGLVVSESRPWLLWLRSRGVPVPWVPPPEFLVEQMLQAGGPEAFESDDEELEEPPEALPGKPPGNGNPAGDGAGGIAAALLEALATPAMLRATRKDPDLFLQAAEASRFLYSACVRMLDRELGRLRTAIEHACGEGPLLFIVTAALGQSLGETVLR